MNIEIIRAGAARSLLGDDDFLAQWSALMARCPWATAFQSPGFCASWYESYQDRFEPVLVASRRNDGTLEGLLCLAASRDGSALVAAGAHQAEYQVWLCAPEAANAFPLAAFSLIQASFPESILKFLYVPNGTPMDWTREPAIASRCQLTAHRRPLLVFGDGEKISAALRKPRRRSHLNSLKRLGPVELARLTEPAELEAIFDELIAHHDLRHAVAHDSAAFRDDPSKKAFHLALMATPGLAHVTVLKVGDRLGSAQFNLCSANEVHTGVIAYHPMMAKQSPNVFHIYYLAQMLTREGFARLDLTPGDDPYKERFATEADEVGVLTLFPTAAGRRRAARRQTARATAKRLLTAVGLTPERLGALMGAARRANPARAPAALARRGRDWVHRHHELRVYAIDASRVPDMADPPDRVRRDQIGDLLQFEPAESWQSRRDLFAAALERFGNGEHLYSHAEAGRLLHYSWLIERQGRTLLNEVGQELDLPPDSAMLYDDYTDPGARGRGLQTESMRARLRDAARAPGTKAIFITVLADNGPSRHVIEKVGFEYQGSLFEEVRWGRVRRWRTGFEALAATAGNDGAPAP